jgi:hypothetical protein
MPPVLLLLIWVGLVLMSLPVSGLVPSWVMCVCVHGVVCCAVACILGVYVWCVCGVSRIKLVLYVFVEVLCFHYLSHFDSSMLAFSIGVS